MSELSEERVERALDVIATGAREAARCELETFLEARDKSPEKAAAILTSGKERAQQIRAKAKEKAEGLLGAPLDEAWL